MSKTPRIRLQSFEENWKTISLKDISIKNTTKNTEKLYTNSLTNSAVQGIVSQESYFDKSITNAKSSQNYYIVKPDDFVYNPRISIFAPVGPVNRNNLNITGIMSPLYYVFSVHSIHLEFLEVYFKTSFWHSFMYRNGDTGARSDRFSIREKVFLEMPIPYPTKKEQTKVGKFFKELDELIEHQQLTIDNLEVMKKGFTQKVFPEEGSSTPEIRFPGFIGEWDSCKLGDIIESYSGGTPSSKNKLYYGGNIPFIRSAEINSISTELFITEEGFNNSSAKMVEKGDILYALYGATSGEVGISKIQGAINQAILAVKPKDDYDSSFIVQWLKKQRSTIINTYLQGGQGNLSGSLVRDLIIKFPADKDEQVMIGEYFKQLDKLIELEKQQLKSLQEMKKGFLQKMFV